MPIQGYFNELANPGVIRTHELKKVKRERGRTSESNNNAEFEPTIN